MVQLSAATTFTANATAGLRIVGGTGADKITAGGAGQVLTGGTGADALTGSSAGNDIFRDSAAGLNGDTIATLLASDVIDITNLAPATAVITNYQVSAAKTVLTLTDGTKSTTITLSGADYGSFALAADNTGGGGTDLIFVPNASLSTFILPTTPVTIVAGPVSSVITATAASLLAGDSITGGTGSGVSNQLLLSGGGAFNLAAPTKLTNIQVITAQEGQGTTAQTVTLRAGLNATVNVASGAAGAGITIIGAANTDVINLGSGNDTVTLGSGETVNGGAGSGTYNVTSATIGVVTIKGGSGKNTLVVTGGGNATMGTKITGMNAVQLAAKTALVANATAALQITGSSVGGDTITLGAPTQSVVAGGANETVKASAANAGASVSGLGANSTLEITTGGTIALNAMTSITTVKLDAASTLVLNGMKFITAVGSSGADTIQAGAINQTLTGGAGADTLIGFAGGSDIFRDTAAGLNGDIIKGLVVSDSIDITNLAFTGAKLTTVTSGANTTFTMTSGTTKSVFTVAGSWSSSSFHLASDGAAGTVLTHT
jgi:Ca2+-binding RTX toxin-like protein